MTTLRQIAITAGVSVNTVSRVLNGKTLGFRKDAVERQATISRIVEELGYHPDGAARAMRSRKTHQIGVLLRNAPDRPLHYPHAFELLLGINQRLESAGYVLSVIRIQDIPSSGKAQSRVFRERMLDGMIVVESIPSEVIGEVEKRLPRCVFLDTNDWRAQRCVRRDEIHAGKTAAEAMLALGYRRLICPRGAMTVAPHYSVEERLAGIAAAVVETPGAEMIERELPHWRVAPDKTQLREILDPGAAIITNSPHEAIRLATFAATIGLCAGVDFGLASCDMTHESEMAMPGLCRVTNDRLALGRASADMMLSLMNNPDAVCPSLRLRDSWHAGDTA